ncbi:MAG TPA: hypothetical protein VMF60_06760, partial [Acidimicrobiales bacterium]|nr:hypothetical protein [Acidimicrobiales bacterium]
GGRPEPVLVGQRAPGATRARGAGAEESLPGFDAGAPAPVGTAEMSGAPFVAREEEGAERVSTVAAAPARRGASRPAKGAAAKGAGTSPRRAAPAPDSAPTGTSGSELTIEELASAAGLSVGELQQLEAFGLMAGRVVGGVCYYDEDALLVARTAAAFAAFGVEARHLRLHKHAAEREAGFIEQIVLPLLKQRNPESRQRAQEHVAELSRLGQTLRAVLLRQALRNQLGG